MFCLVRKSLVGRQFLDHFSTAKNSCDCFKQLYNLTFKIVLMALLLSSFSMSCLATILIHTYSILLSKTYFKLVILLFFWPVFFLLGLESQVVYLVKTTFLQLLCNKYQWPSRMADLESWAKYIRALPIFFPLPVLHLRLSVDSSEKCAGGWSRRSLGSKLAVHVENDRRELQRALWPVSGAAGVKVVKNYYQFL